MASKLDEYKHLFGKASDEKIAEMTGLAPGTVANYRRKHDLPAFDDGEGAEDEAGSGEDGQEESAQTTADIDAGADADDADSDGVEAQPPAKPKAPASKLAVKAGDKAPSHVRITVRRLRTQPPGSGGKLYRRGDVLKGEEAAWLWREHRHAVVPFDPSPRY